MKPAKPAKRPGRGGAREGAGRPPMPAETRRTSVLSTRVTAAEREACETEARRSGEALTEWARRVLMGATALGGSR